jgi:hypothetical protein
MLYDRESDLPGRGYRRHFSEVIDEVCAALQAKNN